MNAEHANLAEGASTLPPFIEISRLGMRFKTRKGDFEALRNIDLKIHKGEFISLIGHSGCGKSTLLNLIAGLTESTTGGVICNGREISGPGPERAVVFQNHSLLPWLTCYENVFLAVEKVFSKTEKRSQLKARTEQALEMVGLAHASTKYPGEISGGMKQRVGIARALSMQPQILLLDEPFGALDALTRAKLQDELVQLVGQLDTTAIMVTHDVDEAVLLSDRIVMLTNGPAATIGEIVQVDLPHPRDRMELSRNEKYHEYRAQVLDFLYHKQQHPVHTA